MANPAPKIINYNFSFLIVSVRRPSHTCASVSVSVSVFVSTEHARMDLVFNLHGSITYLDVSIVAPFSCNPSLVAAASTKPGLMAKRAEKAKFDGYPHINLVPFVLETTGRPGSHAKKFINYLLRDAEMLITHQLLSETPGPPSRAFSTVPSPNNNLWQPLRDYRVPLSHTVDSYILFLCLRVPPPGLHTAFFCL